MKWKQFTDPKTKLSSAGIAELCACAAFTYMLWPIYIAVILEAAMEGWTKYMIERGALEKLGGDVS